MNRRISAITAYIILIINASGSVAAFAQTNRQGKLADKPLYRNPVYDGAADKVIGGHPDVLISRGRAFVFYFTHPGRTIENKGQDNYQTRRSSIQVAELEMVNGQITCNRDKPVCIKLRPQK
ncbi:MAG TPA: hypothetical protein VJ346_05680 [Bacteroidales bacterium]|nr:hypothetical protein [Bacteroidales bacterium]